MGNRAGIDRDGGRTVTDTSGRNNTASDTWGGTGDGTMSGGTSDNWNGTATDTNRNGTTSGGTMSGGTSDNWGGTTSGGTADNWNGTATDTNRNGTATDNRRTASENWNDTAGGRDGVTDYGDTGKRSVTERASDALEDGVRRARDGVENARESVNR